MRTLHSTPRMALAAAALVLLLGACGEKAQTAGTRIEGSKEWNGGQAGFNAPGWKPGDKASWEEQIKQRSRGQNDYARMTP